MASTDDIQMDIAGCLLGVFAVLWMTKSGNPPEDPSGPVDLEIRIRPAEIWHMHMSDHGEHANPGADPIFQSDVFEDVAAFLGGSTLVESTSHVLKDPPQCALKDVPAGVSAVKLTEERSLGITRGQVFVPGRRAQLSCSLRVEPDQLSSGGLALQLKAASANGRIGMDGTEPILLYSPPARWEIMVGGKHAVTRSTNGLSSYGSLAADKREFSGERVLTDCGRHDVAVDAGSETFFLTLIDPALHGQCRFLKAQ